MIDEKIIDEKSIDELKKMRSDMRDDLYALDDIIRDRELEPFNYKGCYIKYYGCNGDGPTYMFVRSAFLTNSRSSETELCLQGHGFTFEVGPYTDSTFLSYSWWDDIYINTRFLLEAEECRKKLDEKDGGLTENNKWKYNSYRLVEISKDEFKESFNEIYNQLPKLFDDMIVNDENDFDNENE